MAKRTKKADRERAAWYESDDCLAKHKACRDEAQALSDADGFDRILESCPTFRYWTHRIIPGVRWRMGAEVTCEKVMCSVIERCKPGHGPLAKRPW
jgi:hypothetical protein